MGINKINCKESDLKDLYDGSAFTMVGFNTDDDNLEALRGWFEEHGAKMMTDDFYIISGKLMNDTYGLTGNNAYPDDIHIVSVKLDDIKDANLIFVARFEIGARWFDDIVDNNAMHQN